MDLGQFSDLCEKSVTSRSSDVLKSLVQGCAGTGVYQITLKPSAVRSQTFDTRHRSAPGALNLYK